MENEHCSETTSVSQTSPTGKPLAIPPNIFHRLPSTQVCIFFKVASAATSPVSASFRTVSSLERRVELSKLWVLFDCISSIDILGSLTRRLSHVDSIAVVGEFQKLIEHDRGDRNPSVMALLQKREIQVLPPALDCRQRSMDPSHHLLSGRTGFRFAMSSSASAKSSRHVLD